MDHLQHNHSREDRISSVFRPSLSAPTMTLEEFGDQQKAEAEERSRNEKDQESHVVKRLVSVLRGPSSACMCVGVYVHVCVYVCVVW
jgi:TAP42-like family